MLVVRELTSFTLKFGVHCNFSYVISVLISNVNPEDSWNYVLFSDIYASMNKWIDEKRVRKLMKDYGTNKMPGSSIVEINDTMHELLIGDNCTQNQKRYF